MPDQHPEMSGASSGEHADTSWHSFDVSALYYDLLRDGQHDPLGPHVARRDDVVIDIGAGTGQLAVQLAHNGVTVVALEPNDAMRSVLLGRLAIDPDARRHVTVLPFAGEDDWTPAGPAMPPTRSVDVAVLHGVIHMLDPTRRHRTFENAARRLRDNGVLLITGVSDTPVAVDIPLGHIDIGALTITGRLVTNETHGQWTTTVEYVTTSDDQTLWTETARYTSFAPTVATITDQLRDAGLRVVWSGRLSGYDTIAASRHGTWAPHQYEI